MYRFWERGRLRDSEPDSGGGGLPSLEPVTPGTAPEPEVSAEPVILPSSSVPDPVQARVGPARRELRMRLDELDQRLGALEAPKPVQPEIHPLPVADSRSGSGLCFRRFNRVVRPWKERRERAES